MVVTTGGESAGEDDRTGDGGVLREGHAEPMRWERCARRIHEELCSGARADITKLNAVCPANYLFCSFVILNTHKSVNT